jgi:probable type I restriction-modification system
MKEIELIDSGVQWIREVPKNWTRVRCKDVLRETKIQVGEDSSKYTLLSLTINGIIVRDLSESKGKFPKEFNTYKIVKPNELVFCLFDVDETPRTVGLVTQEGMLTGAYSVFSVRNVDVNFLYRYFISLDDRKALKPLYRGLRKVIPLPAFLSMPIYLPPLSEQRAIADWLDAKCADIDAAIELQQRMIDKLKAYKTAVIHQAVTKGLDKNANLKDSGVQWIGEVPEHWEVCKVKNICTYVNRGCTPNYVENGTYYAMNQATFSKGFLDYSSLKFTTENRKSAQVLKQDILLASTGGGVLGKVWYYNDDVDLFYAVADVIILRVDPKENDARYLYYDLSIKYQLMNALFVNGSTNQIHLQRDLLKNHYIQCPPLAEQRAIADWLDAKCADIDATIALKEQKQEKLKAYKKTIIFEYVTGKKQVANINKQL